MAILRALFRVITGLISVCFLFLRPRGYLAAENLFLRKPLAFYRERGIKPRRIAPASKRPLILLSKPFGWKAALVIVRSAGFETIAEPKRGSSDSRRLARLSEGSWDD